MSLHHPSALIASPRRHTSPTQALLAAAVLTALAAPAAAQLQLEELPRRGLPAATASTRCVVLADIDGDGDLDLVEGNYAQQNRLYRNDGQGHFTEVTATQMPVDTDSTSSVAVGDVDGDGDVDLVLGNRGGADRLYLNNGQGHFAAATAAQFPAPSLATTALALGDLDGDGDLDLVAGTPYTGNAAISDDRIYTNDGTGTFTQTQSLQNWDTAALALGDVDGDGDLDIVCGVHAACAPKYCFGGQNELYLNNGQGTFTNATAQLPVHLDYTHAVALGDVDGDGDLDLIVGNGHPTGGQNRLCLNDGAGNFTDVTATRMPVDNDNTEALALGDVDDDGDLDVVFANFAFPVAQQNRLYVNDGSGSFSDVTAVRGPVGSRLSMALALGDVDGDEDLDLVVGNNAQQNSLHFNLRRQLHAPVDLRIGQTYSLDAYLRHGQPSQVTFALPYVSLAPASIAVPPFGTLGIDPAQAIALPLLPIPQPAGVGSLNLAIANDPGLLGVAVYSQALIVEYPFQARLSGVVHDVVGQ